VFVSGTIQTYNPAAGMFAGLAVGAANGVGIHQIAQAAGNQEQAAQGIFQRTTIALAPQLSVRFRSSRVDRASRMSS